MIILTNLHQNLTHRDIDVEMERTTVGGCNGSGGMINRMMMLRRFRPIVPKPVTGADENGVKNLVISNERRHKRKYDRSSMVAKERKKKEGESRRNDDQSLLNVPCYLQKFLFMGSSTAIDDPRILQSSSWIRVVVVVERVVSNLCKDVEMDALELGLTDLEKMKTLQGDGLPGFMSDSSNKVIWVNKAFESMIYGGGRRYTTADPAPELVVKELPQTQQTFTCQAKLRRHGRLRGGGAEEKYGTIPCDVWRMDCKGFAWRLDVQTALTLGCYHSRD